MTDNVIELGNVTRLDIPVERVLERAKEHLSGGVIVIGWDNAGEPYFSSSIADGGEVLWLLESMKKRLMEVTQDDY